MEFTIRILLVVALAVSMTFLMAIEGNRRKVFGGVFLGLIYCICSVAISLYFGDYFIVEIGK